MKYFLMLFALLLMFSCTEKGRSKTVFDGTYGNDKLPKEIKDLKLYWVETQDGWGGGGVYVGFLDGFKTTSLSYQEGKTHQSVVLIGSKNEVKTINYKEILVENDSIIVIRK